jgi:hypothetical protein
MSSYDEPTQRVRRPSAPPAPLPGALDPLRGSADPLRGQERETGTGWVEPAEEFDAPTTEPDATGVLPLDQLFDRPPATPASTPAPAATPSVAAEAPTWTAMPVVPVRTEPVVAAAPAYDEPRERGGGASFALAGTWDRLDGWLRRDDNGLMLVTAFVACVLMVIVASVGGS